MDIINKSINKNRRNFLKHTLLGTAGLASYSLLSACSSFDEFLFDDRFTFRDEVMIIGGGIAGLYLAYKLRSSKTEFRLFEGSNFFGGRIKSHSGLDYGASLLSVNNTLAKQLLQELSLQTISLDKDFLYFPDGMQSLTDALFEKTVGLLPYHSYRLRWKLLEIKKLSSGFELAFQNPAGQKRFKCKKIALAIPPTQWGAVKGLLELPEMNWAAKWLESLQVENTIKLILPSSSFAYTPKPYLEINIDGFDIRQIFKNDKAKNDKATSSVELDLRYSAKNDVSVEDIQTLLKKRLQVNYSFQKLSVDHFYDWKQVKLIKGSAFKNHIVAPVITNNNFQIVGDFASAKAIYTIEGALQSAKQAATLFL